MATYIQPLSIKHINTKSTDDRKTLIDECKKTLHMSKSEHLLLEYYSEQSNGFRPSATHIANQLSISRRTVFYSRDMLEKHGIIGIEDDYLYIDWERIRLFSTLDPSLTGNNPTVKPVISKEKFIVDYDFLKYGPEQDVINWFASITEEQFQYTKNYIKRRKAKEKIAL